MAGATGRHEALSLQCAEGRHGLCVAAGHTGELHGAGELRPVGSASIMWPAMHAGAPRSGMGPCECCESRVRSPEAGGGDEGVMPDGGERKDRQR